jgi:ABC-type bacteriocin/lantibiotic exporter with double-glycine peptidase domain
MKLNVPLISQPKNSQDCGIASMAMILKYYTVPFEYDQIKKEIGVFKEGTYAPQLSLFLLKHGFDVSIVTLHPALLNIGHSFKNKTSLLNHLKKMAKTLMGEWNQKAIQFFIRFVQAGGTIIPEVPSEKIIKKEITAGRPVVTCLTHWFLFESNYLPKCTLHFNVITGSDKKYVQVNEHYLYAIHASAQSSIDNACLMLIKKK